MSLEHCHWCSKPIMANDSFCVKWGRLAFHINNAETCCLDRYMAYLKALTRRMIGEES